MISGTRVVSIVTTAWPEAGASTVAVDTAEDTLVETFVITDDRLTALDCCVLTSVDTLTRADAAVLWSTVAVERTADRLRTDDVSVESWVEAETR